MLMTKEEMATLIGNVVDQVNEMFSAKALLNTASKKRNGVPVDTV